MTALSTGTLAQLAPALPVPAYDRAGLVPGIVHLGVGGFHRAHQAAYVDTLLGAGGSEEWGICGVGVLPGDRRMRDALSAQDGLYTLVVKHPDGRLEPRVIGSLVEHLLAPDDPERVVEKLAAASTRIVSLTITEGGYNLDADMAEFDGDDPAVVRDLRPGAVPETVFGLVTEALARRRDRALPPFTVVSCDNIEGNGDVARRAFGAFARLRDPALADWVDEQVRFPSSMVDRITPVSSEQDQRALAEQFGVDDAWPVVCEPYTQWVLEDSFAAGRPALEECGVQLVDEVRPYELMKLRLLNAGHQALGYLGVLAGYRYAHEAAADPLFARFLLAYMSDEATPTLLPVPGVDLPAYRATLVERFANPEVRDTLERLCSDSSDRIPKFLLPVVREQLRTGGELHRSALVVAAWARYAEGVDEQGRPIEVVDRRRDDLTAAAPRQGEDPLAFLRDRQLFGDLAEQPRFTAAYTAALHSLHRRGARATLADLPGST